MNKRISYLENLVSQKTADLSKAPEGRLRININGDYASYYLIEPGSGGNGMYLKMDDRTIRQLAQKKYDHKIIDSAAEELRLVRKLADFQQTSVENIYPQMSERWRRLIDPIRPTDEEFVKAWLDRKFEPMGFSDDAPLILSRNGLRVRSKSERLWADCLDKFSIPFKYEPPLYLEGEGWVRPDFFALNVRLRKGIYIENLGMMDYASYSEDNVRKIQAYAENGLFPGDGLIITMETLRHPINPGTIEDLIRKFLL